MTVRQDILMGGLLVPVTLYDTATASTPWRVVATALCLGWFACVATSYSLGMKAQRLRAEFIRDYGYDPTPDQERAR